MPDVVLTVWRCPFGHLSINSDGAGGGAPLCPHCFNLIPVEPVLVTEVDQVG